MAVDPLDIEKTLQPPDKQGGGYTLAAGQTLGQYKIIRPLVRGVMCEDGE